MRQTMFLPNALRANPAMIRSQPHEGGSSTAFSTDSRHVRFPAQVLDVSPGSTASSLAERFASPPRAFLATALIGYLVLAAVAIGIGFLLVDVLLPIHAIGHTDESVNAWFARHRSGTLNSITFAGSSSGDIPAVPGLVILTVLAAAIARRWRIAAFVAGAIVIEVATYRVTSLIVHRQRPDVPRLDDLPVNQSFPSGHVAASVVVYVALALLISSSVRHRGLVALVWTLAIAIPLLVATSRMYRGMHHPIDVLAGALIGISAIAIALLATRAADGVVHARPATTTTDPGASR